MNFHYALSFFFFLWFKKFHLFHFPIIMCVCVCVPLVNITVILSSDSHLFLLFCTARFNSWFLILPVMPRNSLPESCLLGQGFQVRLAYSHIIRRRQWHPTPVLFPGKSHGWRSLVGCSPWGHEELDMTERLHFHFSLSCIGEGNGTPLQCSCLENPRDRGAWWAAVCGVAQSRT